MRRERREAKRRMVLLSLVASLFFLTLVAFRRSNGFMSDYTHQSTNSTSSASRTSAKSKSWLKSRPKSTGPVLSNSGRCLSDSSLTDLRNTSLGFEKVFVLNMPLRTDKLDAMTLAASVTGFDFDVLEGVLGESISQKALSGVSLPTSLAQKVTALMITQEMGEETWNRRGRGLLARTHEFCERVPLSFLRFLNLMLMMFTVFRIVSRRLSSALIIEDDADWDLNLRSLMEYIALGSQTLLDTPRDEAPRSPYGDGWDLMWFGHCASSPVKGDDRRFIMRNDPNVPPRQHRANYGDIPDMSPYDDHTRIVFFTAGNTCTYSYALSYRGAAKILKYLSIDIFNKPIDYGLREMCEKKDRGFKCISVFPQIFGEHKPVGANERDSDIDDRNLTSVRTKGYSHNTVHSTRLNLEHLIDGRLDLLENQYGEDPQLDGPVTAEYRTGVGEETQSP